MVPQTAPSWLDFRSGRSYPWVSHLGRGVMTAYTGEETFPEGFREPSSVFLDGGSRSLLKWIALALLSPYASRVYWTEIRLAGEVLEPLDPLGLGAVPTERIQVVCPIDLQREEQDARRAEVAVANLLREDEHSADRQRISEFLRLPAHTRERITGITTGREPPILIATNAHRLAGMYPSHAIGPMVRSILDAGACLVLLWADAAPSERELFDMVLHVEGAGPSHWREATLTCEKGVASGPLSLGNPVRLTDLHPIERVLERSLP